MLKKNQVTNQIFLAGSSTVGVSTWRQDTVIPMLERARKRYFNPQKEGWTPEDAVIEAAELEKSKVVLMYLDDTGRGLNSLQELVEVVCRGQTVFLVFGKFTEGQVIEGQTITGRELKDLNNMRGWVEKFIARHPNAVRCETLEEAAEKAIRAC